MRTLLLADDSVAVQRVIALTFAEQPIQIVTIRSVVSETSQRLVRDEIERIKSRRSQ